jgi:hypothetical protein
MKVLTEKPWTLKAPRAVSDCAVCRTELDLEDKGIAPGVQEETVDGWRKSKQRRY